jgi:K+-transporting ATPase ATPase C chain
MFKELRAAIILFVLMFLLTGIGYPLVTLHLAQKLFSYQANGSLIEDSGKIIGSELIGQNFSSDIYFHARPSAAGDKGYDASNSSASNLATTSGGLLKAVTDRLTAIKNLGEFSSIPVDMVTASASGLDPDISPNDAMVQEARIAAARHLNLVDVDKAVTEATEDRTFGFLGDRRVNVLKLNRMLDRLIPLP